MLLERQTVIRQLYSLIKDYRNGGPYPTTDKWDYSALALAKQDADKLISRVVKSSEKIGLDETRIVCLINTKLSINGG